MTCCKVNDKTASDSKGDSMIPDAIVLSYRGTQRVRMPWAGWLKNATMPKLSEKSDGKAYLDEKTLENDINFVFDKEIKFNDVFSFFDKTSDEKTSQYFLIYVYADGSSSVKRLSTDAITKLKSMLDVYNDPNRHVLIDWVK
jgi:hypothetical protein